MNFVPRYMTRHQASALTLFDRDKIDLLVENGVLHDYRDGRGWSRIPLHEIEAIRRRPVTVDDYLAAKAALREIRDRQPCRRKPLRCRSPRRSAIAPVGTGSPPSAAGAKNSF
jgi:hypothetical protein